MIPRGGCGVVLCIGFAAALAGCSSPAPAPQTVTATASSSTPTMEATTTASQARSSLPAAVTPMPPADQGATSTTVRDWHTSPSRAPICSTYADLRDSEERLSGELQDWTNRYRQAKSAGDTATVKQAEEKFPALLDQLRSVSAQIEEADRVCTN